MTVEEVSAAEQGIYIEKLRGFPSCHSVVDGISGEACVDKMWVGLMGCGLALSNGWFGKMQVWFIYCF